MKIFVKGIIDFKKSFLLYILEKNALNKTWRTPFEKMFF